jgi:hypothetical protein
MIQLEEFERALTLTTAQGELSVSLVPYGILK